MLSVSLLSKLFLVMNLGFSNRFPKQSGKGVSEPASATAGESRKPGRKGGCLNQFFLTFSAMEWGIQKIKLKSYCPLKGTRQITMNSN